MELNDNYQRKGPWSSEEDECLRAQVILLGERRWDSIAKATGLRRSGKSCRLRWLNYLQPNLKRSPINPEEEKIILQLHTKWGNKWAKIARSLPGRTDNEIKNYWRAYSRKKNNFNSVPFHPIKEEEDLVSPTCSSSTTTYIMNSTGVSWQDQRLISNKTSEEMSCGSVADCSMEYPTDVMMSSASSPYENHYLRWSSLLLPDGSASEQLHQAGFRWENVDNNGFENSKLSHAEIDTQGQGYCWDALWNL